MMIKQFISKIRQSLIKIVNIIQKTYIEKLKERLKLVFILSAFLIIFGSMTINAISGQDILDQVSLLDINDVDSYLMEIKVINYKDKNMDQADMKVYLNRVEGNEKSIATFVQPANLQDDLYLSIDNNTWMYKKGLKRPIRISPQQKLFGDAGIAETVGINYSEKYNVANNTEEDGHYCLELEAKDSGTAYQKAIIWVEHNTFNLSRALLLAVNGQQLKELTYSNYRYLNKIKVSDIMIKNLLYVNSHTTELLIKNISQYTLPSEAFQPLMLNKFDLFRRGN